MAGKEPEPEDLPFEIPEFNEDEFVRKELISFRTTIILFVYSLAISLITIFVWRAYDVPFFALLLLAVAAGAALPFIYKMFRIDISHFKRKEWIGTMSLHFFFWLGFTLLLANPPLSDSAAPVVEIYGTPSVQNVGEEIKFAAYIADNRGLDESKTQFCLTRENSTGCLPLEWTKVEDKPVWTATWRPNATGKFAMTIDAVDDAGHPAEGVSTVNVTNPFPVIDPPTGTTFNSLSQSLVVRPHAGFRDLRAVQYVIDGTPHNMLPPSGDRPYWTSDPTYPGWKVGDNNVTIVALEQPVYLHGYKLEGGIASSGAGRLYKVDANFPDLASATSPDLKERPAPNLAQTPGPSPLVLLIGILFVALAIRRTRRHE